MKNQNQKSQPKEGTQLALALTRLLASPGEWIPAPELFRFSGARALSANIGSLRKYGHHIENRTERVGRKVHSFYRLVLPTEPTTQA